MHEFNPGAYNLIAFGHSDETSKSDFLDHTYLVLSIGHLPISLVRQLVTQIIDEILTRVGPRMSIQQATKDPPVFWNMLRGTRRIAVGQDDDPVHIQPH